MEERLALLEQRIIALENDRDRLLNGLKSAAESAMNNPMVKAMLPREMRENLEKLFAAEIVVS